MALGPTGQKTHIPKVVLLSTSMPRCKCLYTHIHIWNKCSKRKADPNMWKSEARRLTGVWAQPSYSVKLYLEKQTRPEKANSAKRLRWEGGSPVQASVGQACFLGTQPGLWTCCWCCGGDHGPYKRPLEAVRLRVVLYLCNRSCIVQETNCEQMQSLR